METIKIVHQIWSDKYQPLPAFCQELTKTWKENHSDWDYILWNEEMLDRFVKEEYPEFYRIYNEFTYDMQRWDSARFLILKKMGGLHVDVDYECLDNITPLINNATFAIALEPKLHGEQTHFGYAINSALVYSIPNHFFLDKVIDSIFLDISNVDLSLSKLSYVLKTTSVEMLTCIYDHLSILDKNQIKLLPAKNVAPFDHRQLNALKAGVENDELEKCLEEAYAVHYYTYLWR